MSTLPSGLKMRSWLFAPGDSLKKMTKASDSAADIALLDLEDAVMPQNKPQARELVREFLATRDDKNRIWVRINPLSSGEAERDLDAIMEAAPGGILLPKAEGGHDVEALDTLLNERESGFGLARGSTRVAALVTETAAAMFATGTYAGTPRLVAMTWGAEDLSAAIGSQEQRGPDGEYSHTFEMARSLCLLGAAKAGVAAIETVQPEFRDLDKLKSRAERVRRQGFSGMLAIHPAQVEPINTAFTPSEAELAHARAIVQAFADNPGAGTVALDGNMLDRPHLALAERILAEASE
ncbi:MAG: CoA ester lyase [Erythrobacter sp.]